MQFSLTFVALKALPVLILGGFDSMPGAIVGGLIIGAVGEARRGLPRAVSSAAASKAGSPYVLALLFLLVRPEGLFGEKHHRRRV